MQNFIVDFLAVVKRKESFCGGEKFLVKLVGALPEIELEPFSGYSKPNLDRKVVLGIEIIEEICRNKKEALKLVGKWRNLTYCEG